jgi:hypothetical protein
MLTMFRQPNEVLVKYWYYKIYNKVIHHLILKVRPWGKNAYLECWCCNNNATQCDFHYANMRKRNSIVNAGFIFKVCQWKIDFVSLNFVSECSCLTLLLKLVDFDFTKIILIISFESKVILCFPQAHIIILFNLFIWKEWWPSGFNPGSVVLAVIGSQYTSTGWFQEADFKVINTSCKSCFTIKLK